jgi:hypothetical protein
MFLLSAQQPTPIVGPPPAPLGQASQQGGTMPRPFDQPREGDPPHNGGTWEAVQTTQVGHQPLTTVVSGGHPTENAAVEALAQVFQEKAAATDWPPTKSGWQRGIAEIRRNHQTKVFSVTYAVRPTPDRTG